MIATDPALAELFASLESALADVRRDLNAVETRLTTLETETVDSHGERTHKNTTEAILAKQRELARRVPVNATYDPHSAERQRLRHDRAFWETDEGRGRPWLVTVQAEEQAALDALGAEPPAHFNEWERSDWRRKREAHEDTLVQIRESVREAPAGELYALARRDGIDRRDLERMSGLRRIEEKLAEIDAALAALDGPT